MDCSSLLALESLRPWTAHQLDHPVTDAVAVVEK
jgi:hypothetical protein